eukprot:14854397-Ditylum_brightwellii.AAC.1
MPAKQPGNHNETMIVQFIRQNLGSPPVRDRLFRTWISSSSARGFEHNDVSLTQKFSSKGSTTESSSSQE